MGNSSSKKKSKKGGKGSGGDDGCIGNRRVRTIILSLLLIVFFAMGMPSFNDARETSQDVATYGEDAETVANAMAAIFAGACICIVGAICCVLLFIIPSCADKLGRVAGFVLVVGGVIYLIGWIVYVVKLNDSLLGEAARGFGGDIEQQWNARLSALIGEALLPSGAAILLGLDAAFQIYENEAYRLSSNLGLIMVVSAMCVSSYYAQICQEADDDDTLFTQAAAVVCVQPDGVEMIATGYLILFWVCLVYIILYILTCCTCDCKDKCLVRLIIAVTLVIGGLLTAIGYYVYVGGDDATYTGDDQDSGVVYFVGYSILIAGLAIVWALDMAFDDVKNR